ncbi:MAG: ABC transporter substrate-binding protein [Deltaproteobacteria bacterium]|nr:ABC transporter substrate-binding protein [Deltaproteobacteria bacterium]MCZ6561480.1 ABC transporter substrate-binding protein [Deltaproteobacteria bacterium]
MKRSLNHPGVAVLFAALLLWGSGAFYASSAEAAEKSKLVVRLDFIVGGKHAPWFIARDKGFYSKRGLSVDLQAGKGSADTVRAIGAGLADVGFADMATTIVARSRGIPVLAVAQLGYVPVTIVWREETPIKGLKDLEGKSWAISPGQAQWYLMPAFCKINNINFKAIKVQNTAPPLQPAALVAKKVDFITMFRASNDEVAQRAATKRGIKLKRIYMRDNGLNIYGSSLIVREELVKKRPDAIRAYVEATMEGLRYARDHQEEALQILVKHKPELKKDLARVQLKHAVEEVFILPESLKSGFGFMQPDLLEKTVRITNKYFTVGRKVSSGEVYTNQFIKK